MQQPTKSEGNPMPTTQFVIDESKLGVIKEEQEVLLSQIVQINRIPFVVNDQVNTTEKWFKLKEQVLSKGSKYISLQTVSNKGIAFAIE